MIASLVQSAFGAGPLRILGPGFISGHGTPMLSDQALKQGRLEDALACTGDEGRSKLR